VTVELAELITFKGFGKTFSTKAGDLRAAQAQKLIVFMGRIREGYLELRLRALAFRL